MKCEILCPPCREKFDKLFPNDNPHPGEYITRKTGRAIKPGFFCDACVSPICIGEKCSATSISSDSFPYFPWEDDFIESGHGGR